jgi:RNA-directed DNA polymerase
MKREGNLLPRIVDRDNLLRAFLLASRGRRAAADVVAFRDDLDGNLRRMARQIEDGTIEVGRFTRFTIRDPKPRSIFAPAFAERVLHQALMAVAAPRLDRYLSDQTYACRVGRGTHAAVDQAQKYARVFSHVLHLDVRHYFDAIDQDRLMGLLRRLWKDRAVLALVERIVRSYEVEPGKGLPIGALTSQHLANVYLGVFDHFAKERLGCRGYVRYMDDMLLFADGAEPLRQWLREARAWLEAELGLQLKPPVLRPVLHGFDFLGVRVWRRHRTLTGTRKRRWATSLRRLCRGLAAGVLDERAFAARSGSLMAHAASVRSRGLRASVLARLPWIDEIGA